MHKIMDFRSDTVTRPSEEMRKVIASAAVGDDIYGRGGQRLCLHASLLEFDHPALQRRMRFESAPEF